MSLETKTHSAVGFTGLASDIQLLQLSTEKPGPGELLVRVLYCTLGPVDFWQVQFGLPGLPYPNVLGFSLTGEVVEVGASVEGFEQGDKIFSCPISLAAKSRGVQEYAVIDKHAVAKLPNNVTVEEAAGIPDNFVTAYWTVFSSLRLPEPSSFPITTPPVDASAAILVWGAGSSSGQYIIQTLSISGYTNIIAVASSRNHEFLRSLGATAFADYRSPTVVDDILKLGPIKYAIDTIADEDQSLKFIAKVLRQGSTFAFLLPIKEGKGSSSSPVNSLKREMDVKFEDGVNLIPVATMRYQADPVMKEKLQPKVMPDLVGKGLIKPNRYRLVEGATLFERAKNAFNVFKRGEATSERLVVKIAEA